MLHDPAIYALSERERAAVNMQGTVFALAGLKIVPTIKNLTCRGLHYVRCDAVQNYMLCRDSQPSGWVEIWGSSQELYVFTVFLTAAR